ncbi:adhesion G protein-coupled receptor E5 isoform X1 [Pogona vitticeps]
MKPARCLLLALGLFVVYIESEARVEDSEDDQGKPLDGCGSHARFVEPPGNYSCECLTGFESKKWPSGFNNKSDNDCTDIDECQQNASICGPNGHCINIKGDYHCKCKPGFVKSQKNDRKICRDINECIPENPCDKNANCTNFPGGYKCKCRNGYFQYQKDILDGKEIIKCKENSCPVTSEDNCSNTQTSLCNFEKHLGDLCQSSLSAKKLKDPNVLLMALLTLLDEGIKELEAESPVQRHRIATKMMESVEGFLRVWAFSQRRAFRTEHNKGTELTMEIRTPRNWSQSPAQLSHSQTQMKLNWEAASKEGEGLSLIGLITYRGFESILTEADVEGEVWEQVGKSPPWAQVAGKPTYKVLSRVAAAFVGHSETSSLSAPVTVTFSHQNADSKPDVKVICAFWQPVNGSGRWSERGCTRLNTSTATTTHCQCDHLTSFAVLMAFYDVEDWNLTIITKIGLVVSLVCLFLSILTFLFCRAIRGIRTTLHLHLCLALFVAHVIFLLGAGNPSNKMVCAVVAGMLHYFFLSVFCWMLLEGVELYLMVVQVFKTHSLKHWHLYFVGYGLPAILVGLSAAINSKGYGNKHCWLSRENGFLWSFLGPVSLIIMVNAVVFVVTVWKLSQKFTDINPDMTKLKKQRVLTITAIAQLCILGTTWIFGMFQISNNTLVMSYIFTILNSLQGLFIFLLHCLLKKQVRDDYYRWFCQSRCSKGQGSDKYSDFSSTSASNTLRAQKSFRESGM